MGNSFINFGFILRADTTGIHETSGLDVSQAPGLRCNESSQDTVVTKSTRTQSTHLILENEIVVLGYLALVLPR